MSEWSLFGLLVGSVALPLVWYRFRQNQGTLQNLIAKQPRLTTGTARFMYFIGLPYLAILLGLLTTQQLGLTGLEFFALVKPDGASLIPQLLQAILLMLLSWLLGSSATLLAGGLVFLFVAALRGGLARQAVEVKTVRPNLVSVLYQAVHWAFYRALCWAITGDLYLGVVLGGLVALLEAGLIDLVRGRTPLEQPNFLHKTLLLVLTATIFFYGLNWWLLLPIHWGLAALTYFDLPTRIVSQPSSNI